MVKDASEMLSIFEIELKYYSILFELTYLNIVFTLRRL